MEELTVAADGWVASALAVPAVITSPLVASAAIAIPVSVLRIEKRDMKFSVRGVHADGDGMTLQRLRRGNH